ncbi:septal ring lytic transglycosylase RlpA family protein [Flavihumibacter petaseus]|uniref:Probable endolytic peptidoglycan transglycosylase RlpA n=1 Tax=Flavihumibacter petaseus NBRC 106054 TaxID=1220578 RepID=A0A0E9N0A3_9BACT|nr:septal ring lytic transglycosylase RlpA family protein [Flavihumibacter petaseus]GAO43279.1 putative RlpA-like lipoprotein [Flavihumibacter petaseus NBRC 106054]
MKILPRVLLALSLLYTGVAVAQSEQTQPPTRKKRKANTAKVQYGTASYYASKFNGRKTASGEIYDSQRMTAAHNGLPLGTWIKVTNMRNKRTVIVRINDRLHYRNPRLVDLSRAAAKKLGYTGHGLAKVKVEVLGKKTPAELPALTTNK